MASLPARRKHGRHPANQELTAEGLTGVQIANSAVPGQHGGKANFVTRVEFFAPEVGDAAVARRLLMLRAGGAEVRLVGFARARSERPPKNPT